ncbi:MAG: hypothetical protein PUP90_27050 [Nostoc sp. S4]|nr:hypothetical protein [Nostoc sp. S4]
MLILQSAIALNYQQTGKGDRTYILQFKSSVDACGLSLDITLKSCRFGSHCVGRVSRLVRVASPIGEASGV